jgi:ATP-binding cassette, subfamily B, bacterial
LGVVNALAREVGLVLRERTSRHAQGKIIDVASAVELEAYENPAFHDRLVRASKGGQVRPMQLVEGGLGLVGGLGGIIGVTVALLALQPWLVPLVFAAAVPVLITAAKAGEEMFGFHCRQTPAERERRYVYGLLTEKAAAQELRAFTLAAFLRRRYEQLYDQYMAELRALARRRLRLMLLGTLGMSVPLLGTFGLLLYLALAGRLSLAEAATAAGAVLVLGERLTITATSAGDPPRRPWTLCPVRTGLSEVACGVPELCHVA